MTSVYGCHDKAYVLLPVLDKNLKYENSCKWSNLNEENEKAIWMRI